MANKKGTGIPITLQLGVSGKPLKEQLAKQGFKLRDGLKYPEQHQEHIYVCGRWIIQGLLTEKEGERVRHRIMKDIMDDVVPIEPKEESK